MGILRKFGVVLLALAVLPSAMLAQERGTITGRVTDQGTGQAVQSAQIRVQGTALRTVTDAQGRFRIGNIPPGTYTVSASQVGRETANRTVTVGAGQTQDVTFALGTSAVAIEGLVVQATGETQRAREVGVSVPKINVADVPLAATNDLSQVLQGRAAGVTVLQASGTTGTGARIRIRGSASVSLSNDPLFVIDGVRSENSNGNSIGVGGQSPNRLNDINPEDIESIEILKGPAASALYGTAAANGVIVVTTKKGRAGRTRWNFYTEQGRIEEPNDYPANYSGFCTVGLSSGPRTIGGCDSGFAQDLRSRGFTVTLDSLQQFNPLENSETTPFADGSRQKYGFTASGGTEQATFFLSADLENEVGVYEDINELDRINLRANTRATLRDNLDVTVNTGFVSSDLRLPQNDNNILGIVSSAFLGGATKETGFGFFTVDQLQTLTTKQNVERLSGSVTTAFRPTTWLNLNSTVGLDNVNRTDSETVLPQQIFFASLPEGNRQNNRIRISNYTATLNGTANYGLTPNLTGSTSVGTQYEQRIFRGNFAFGRGLLAGCQSLNCTATGFSVGETNSDVRTIGAYAQQQLGLNDRLFLTAAVRGDDNNAFGEDFGFVVYPSLTASWVVAEEPWFPQFDALSLFRLRAAYGESGLRPGLRDAIRFLSPTQVTLNGQSVPSFVLGGAGNAGLKPERSREVEAGFDIGLFDDRVGMDFTYYNKRSEDALIFRPLPPSLGNPLGRFDNLAEVSNRGYEAALRLQPLRSSRLDWDVNLTYSQTRNRLESLGIDPTSGAPIQPIIFGLGGDSQRHQEGFPLGAYFQKKFTFDDANGDGLIGIDEVEVEDEDSFLGSPFPTKEISLQSNATLFNVVKLSGLLDYRGGYKNFNSTEEFRCGAFFNCRAAFAGYPGVGEVSLQDQANYIAAGYYGTAAGYIEDASFLKLREVSATFTLPASLARRARAEGMSLTLAGRNLATWTDYSGLDPEINFAGSGSNFSTAEFLTQPPVRYFTARVDLNF